MNLNKFVLGIALLVIISTSLAGFVDLDQFVKPGYSSQFKANPVQTVPDVPGPSLSVSPGFKHKPVRPGLGIPSLKSSHAGQVREFDYHCENCHTPITINLGDGQYKIKNISLVYGMSNERNPRILEIDYYDRWTGWWTLNNWVYLYPGNHQVSVSGRGKRTNKLRFLVSPKDSFGKPIHFDYLYVKVFWVDQPPAGNGGILASGCTYTTNYSVDFDFTDPDSNISEVIVTLDGNEIFNETGINSPEYSLHLNYTINEPGTHNLYIKVTDEYGGYWDYSSPIDASPSPDFNISNVVVNASDSDHPVVVSFVLANNGQPHGGGEIAEYYLNDSLIKRKIYWVTPGESRVITEDLGLVTPGSYTLRIILTPQEGGCPDIDPSDNSFETTFVVNTPNHPPIADFYWTPSQIISGETIVTFVDNSTDPDNNILRRDWDLGDGNHSTGPVVHHTYIQPGIYDVTLTVTDEGGLSDSITKQVVVLARPEIVNFTANPDSGYSPLNVSFYFKVTDQDSGYSDPLNVSLDYGDGQSAEYILSPDMPMNVSHTYAISGVYTATLTVTDKDGLSTSEIRHIQVSNPTPVIQVFQANPSSGTAPLTVNFTILAVDENDKSLDLVLEYGDGNQYAASINNDTQYTISYTYTNPGIYNAVLEVTDDEGASDTASVQINVSQAVFTIPDLTITGVNIPQNLEETKNYSITVNVSNIGNASASNVDVRFSYSQTKVQTLSGKGSDQIIGDIAPGETKQVTFDWTPGIYGNYTLFFQVDPDNIIKESNETNNNYETMVYVSPLPDFSVDENSIMVPSLVEGHEANVSVIVWNLGHAPGNVTVVFSLSPPGVAQSKEIYLAPQTSEIVNFTITPPNGTLTVAVDLLDGDEINLTNNHASKTISASPDQPPVIEPIPDQVVMVGETLHLIVNASDPEGDKIKFSDNTSLFDINPDTGEVNYTAQASDVGNYTIQITASDGIKSSSTTFNLEVKSANAFPDLVTSISGPTNVWAGDTVQVNVTVKNQGNDDSGPFWVSLDDGTVQYQKIDNLAPGESKILQFNWTAPDVDGVVTLVAIADVYNDVNETNETNNNATLDVQVTRKRYDVSVSSLVVPGTVYVNDSFHIQFNVSNLGNQPVETKVVVLVNGTQIYQENVTLGVGQTREVTTNYSISQLGSYIIEAVADPDDEIAETNETNNEASSQIQVVENKPPVAEAGPDVWVKVGEPATFNASESYDPDGTIVSFHWEFGDGANASGEVVNHTYTSTGVYEVTLTVTDDYGASSKDKTLAIVWNDSALPDFAVYVPDGQEFVNGELNTFEVRVFNLGNETGSANLSLYLSGNLANLTNFTLGPKSNVTMDVEVYVNISSSPVLVKTIVDENNSVQEANENNNEWQRNVTVKFRPVARFVFSPTSGYAPLKVEFNASESYDPDGTIVSFYWEFGDGANASGEVVNHTYASPGTYTAKLEVVDNDGLSSTATKVVTVSSRPSGGHGGGGYGGGGYGGGAGGGIIPPTPKPGPVVIPGIISATSDGISEVVDYYYDPEKNETTLTLVFKGMDGSHTYRIELEIPKSIAKNIDDVTLTPGPDQVIKRDPIIAWFVGLTRGATFTVKMTIPGKVDPDLIKSMPPARISIVLPSSKPKQNQTQANQTTVPATNATNATQVTNAANATSPITGLLVAAKEGLGTLVGLLLLAGILALLAIALEKSGYRVIIERGKPSESLATTTQSPPTKLETVESGKPEELSEPEKEVSAREIENMISPEQNQEEEKPITADTPGNYESGSLYKE